MNQTMYFVIVAILVVVGLGLLVLRGENGSIR